MGRIVVQESYICLKILFMIREVIIEALKKRGIKQIELARHLDINRSSLNAFLKGNGKISLANVEKSFLFLGIEMVLKDK
nr:MAG TPA: helix-turn-helix domain protein [virus sp. ct3kA5]